MRIANEMKANKGKKRVVLQINSRLNQFHRLPPEKWVDCLEAVAFPRLNPTPLQLLALNSTDSDVSQSCSFAKIQKVGQTKELLIY